MKDNSLLEERVLMIVPSPKDGEVTAKLLLAGGVSSVICRDICELCMEFERGAAALILTQESVLFDPDHVLQNTLKNQPGWSDVPVIVLTSAGRDPTNALQKFEEIGHMTLIKRPVQINNFISTIHSALRDRQRQYKIREDLYDKEAQAEEMKGIAAQANAANIAKTEFLANMSHEIRTPMNAIIGLSTILEKSQPLSDKQRKFVETLRQSGESLLMLINDLLDIAKIEASGIEIETINFSLEKILDEVTAMLAVRAQEKGLEIKLDLAEIKGHSFLGDPHRIRQILINLGSNALKFTEFGAITFRARIFEKGDNIHDVAVTIEDTGIGIAADKLESIFDKFTQADNTISREFGGTGLGLAISKTLAELMDGKIGVTSTIGTGSAFTVVLPLPSATSGEAQSLIKAIDSKLSESKGRILLVEDYHPNVLVATTILEMFGYSCDVAENGRLAIEKATRSKYAAILMDVQMPELNGIDATILIRQHEVANKSSATPIIGMTAHALASDRDKCLAAGMNDYISKPFTPGDLEKKLAILAK